MVVGTKRFIIFQVLTLLSLLIWVIWSMKVFHVTLCVPDIKLQVIVGALLILAEIMILGVRDNKIKDLKFSEFKRITWSHVFDKACLSVLFAIIIVLIIKIINPVVSSLKSDLGNIAVQIVGGLVSGLIGFASAMRMYRYQQKNIRREEIKEDIEKLWFEIVHNMLKVKSDIRTDTPFFRKLELSCWDAKISSRLPINGMIKGELGDLYGDIDLYNYIHQIRRVFTFQEAPNKDVPEKLKLVENTLPKILCRNIEHASALLFGEMVRLGYRQEKDWIHHEIDWEKDYNEFKSNLKKKD